MLESPLVKMLLRRGRRTLEWLHWLWTHTVAIALRTDEDHVFMLAAGIAFNILTSLVPTILLVLFVLGYVLDSDSIMRQLNEWASTFIVTQGYRQDWNCRQRWNYRLRRNYRLNWGYRKDWSYRQSQNYWQGWGYRESWGYR